MPHAQDIPADVTSERCEAQGPSKTTPASASTIHAAAARVARVRALIEHMTGDALVQRAWSLGEAPPIGQREFRELVRRWAQTGAACRQ